MDAPMRHADALPTPYNVGHDHMLDQQSTLHFLSREFNSDDACQEPLVQDIEIMREHATAFCCLANAVDAPQPEPTGSQARLPSFTVPDGALDFAFLSDPQNRRR